MKFDRSDFIGGVLTFKGSPNVRWQLLHHLDHHPFEEHTPLPLVSKEPVKQLVREGSLLFVESEICDALWGSLETLPLSVTFGALYDASPVKAAFVVLGKGLLLNIDNALLYSIGWMPDPDNPSSALALAGFLLAVDEDEHESGADQFFYVRLGLEDTVHGTDEGDLNLPSVVGLVMAFIGQKVAVLAPMTWSRAERRRFEKARETPPDNIYRVTLREARPVIQPTQAERRPTDYQSRWLVRGHWRNQWFPKARSHHPLWITGYVKGPEGKPLKSGSRIQVFDVSR